MVDGIVDTFSFHTPYDNGCELFEDKSYPREIGSKENTEVVFQVERPVRDNAKITITESKAIKEISNAIQRIVEY